MIQSKRLGMKILKKTPEWVIGVVTENEARGWIEGGETENKEVQVNIVGGWIIGGEIES